MMSLKDRLEYRGRLRKVIEEKTELMRQYDKLFAEAQRIDKARIDAVERNKRLSLANEALIKQIGFMSTYCDTAAKKIAEMGGEMFTVGVFNK